MSPGDAGRRAMRRAVGGYRAWLQCCLDWLLPSWGMLRVSVYYVCVFSLLTWLAGRVLWARVAEGGQALGHELAQLSDLITSPEALTLNGVRFQHSSRIVPASVTSALDRAEGACQVYPGATGSFLSEVERSEPERFKTFAPPGAWSRGVLRDETAAHGFVVCLVRGGEGGLRGLLAASERYQRTGDITEFGRLRYFYAERVPTGTRLMSLWTDDTVNLERMFPGDRDAQGSDSEWLPRPPHAQRLISAASGAMPIALRIYESDRPALQIRAFYAAWFAERGFALTQYSARVTGQAYLAGDGRQVFLSLSEHAGRTVISLSEAGRPDAVAISHEVTEQP